MGIFVYNGDKAAVRGRLSGGSWATKWRFVMHKVAVCRVENGGAVYRLCRGVSMLFAYFNKRGCPGGG